MGRKGLREGGLRKESDLGRKTQRKRPRRKDLEGRTRGGRYSVGKRLEGKRLGRKKLGREKDLGGNHMGIGEKNA